jgi:hypothetical protein
VKFDIKGFFDECNWQLSLKYLKHLTKHIPAMDMEIIKEMVINPDTGGLYQGSPVSGILSNAILKPAVKYLQNIFLKEEKLVSFYADDITVSGKTRFGPKDVKRIKSTIYWVFKELGLPFTLKKEKTKTARHNGRKITGVRLNHHNEVTVPRIKYRMLRTYLEHLANDKEITIPKRTLVGVLSHAVFIDDSKKIARLVEKYETVIIDKLHMSQSFTNKILVKADMRSKDFANQMEEVMS